VTGCEKTFGLRQREQFRNRTRPWHRSKVVTRRIEDAINKEMKASHDRGLLGDANYGANDPHPKHLVYWVVVRSDKEKATASNSMQT